MKGKSACSMAACRLAALVLAAMLVLTGCSGGGGGGGLTSSSKLLKFIETYHDGYNLTGEVTSNGSTVKIDMISNSSAEYIKYTLGSVSEITLKDSTYTYTLNESAKTYTQKTGATRSGYGLPDKNQIKSVTVGQQYSYNGVIYDAETATIQTGTSSTRDIIYCFDSTGTLRYMMTTVGGTSVVVKYNSFSTAYDATKLTLGGYKLEGSDEPKESVTVTVGISITPSGSGTVSGAGTYTAGDTVTVKATANTGYTFAGWQKNGSTVSTSKNYTFTAAESVTLTAVFEKEKESTVEIGTYATPNEGGTVSGSGTYTVGDSVTVIATPNTGYHFISWQNNGATVSSDTSYTFTAADSVSLTAVFEKDPVSGISIDEKHFPDAIFRSYVLTQFDTDGDGYLSDSECLMAQDINVSGKGIADLTGIEYFTNVVYLDCSNNNLTNLDISQNTALSLLNCARNNLAKLDITSNTLLQREGAPLIVDNEVLIISGDKTFWYVAITVVSGSGQSTYKTKSGSTLTAKTDSTKDGCQFKGWQKDGVIVSTNTSYSFVAEKSCTLTAIYEKSSVYNGSAAAAWGAANYKNNYGLCAEFVWNCVKQGGLTISKQTGVGGLRSALLNTGYFTEYSPTIRSGSAYIRLSDNAGKLAVGDVVIYQCVGGKSNGVYAHTALIYKIENDKAYIVQRNSALTSQYAAGYYNNSGYSWKNGNVKTTILHYTG